MLRASSHVMSVCKLHRYKHISISGYFYYFINELSIQIIEIYLAEVGLYFENGNSYCNVGNL